MLDLAQKIILLNPAYSCQLQILQVPVSQSFQILLKQASCKHLQVPATCYVLASTLARLDSWVPIHFLNQIRHVLACLYLFQSIEAFFQPSGLFMPFLSFFCRLLTLYCGPFCENLTLFPPKIDRKGLKWFQTAQKKSTG